MGPKKTDSDFRWTDDKIQLLLQICLEYKTKEEYKAFSWESIINKHENICEILVEIIQLMKLTKKNFEMVKK